MSTYDLMTTLDRIKYATERSKIAVFKSNISGSFDSYFNNTVVTQRMIKHDPRYIGSYCTHDKRKQVKEDLLYA